MRVMRLPSASKMEQSAQQAVTYPKNQFQRLERLKAPDYSRHYPKDPSFQTVRSGRTAGFPGLIAVVARPLSTKDCDLALELIN